MKITVLTVPDCPYAPLVLERLTEALGGRPVPIELVEITDECEATRWGMTGSPTVLVDGLDAFPLASAPASMSCRLYRNASGVVEGAPSVRDLRRALTKAGATAGSDGCCEVDVVDPIGRGGRGRVAPIAGGLRAVHQAVLRHLAVTGRPPQAQSLDPVAEPFGRSATDVLTELAREDFLTVNHSGQIQAAYPFSATPTRHQVQIIDGPQVWAMCVIDALGISAMLGNDVVISSTDPITADPISVTTGRHTTAWKPVTAVVFVGRRRCCSGSAAQICCEALNFFTNAQSARTWAAQHPEFVGTVIDQTRAEQLGRQIFGPLLADT
jgi:hypothetical protein